MSVFSFIKDVGEKLLNHAPAAAAQAPASSPSTPAAAGGGQQAQDVANGETIKKYVESLGLGVTGLNVTYDSATYTATLKGTAADQASREKAVLAAGNVMNVSTVDDQLTTTAASPAQSKFHTVEKGDTLSKIAKQYYGDANKYNKIFQANQPMLKNPDQIYPGQVLRIPD